MGQCSPKLPRERNSSTEHENRSENKTTDELNTNEGEDKRLNKMLLTSEKARDTATWIMTTWYCSVELIELAFDSSHLNL